jgi:predicted nucleotidyltransferase
MLRLLNDAGIEFIVVGMTAAVLLGVPTTTQDLDIVHRRTADNIERLLVLLEQVGAHYRYDMARRRLAPTAEALAGRGHLNLQTIHGPLDLLCTVDERGYEELLADCTEVADETLSVRALDLPALIAIKTRAGRPKDKLAIPLLLATLDEVRKRDRDS